MCLVHAAAPKSPFPQPTTVGLESGEERRLFSGCFSMEKSGESRSGCTVRVDQPGGGTRQQQAQLNLFSVPQSPFDNFGTSPPEWQ